MCQNCIQILGNENNKNCMNKNNKKKYDALMTWCPS